MGRGKECAQVAHASMLWLTTHLSLEGGCDEDGACEFSVWLKSYEQAWIDGSYAKIILQVDSEADLFDIHKKAIKAELESHMITDLGLTEFNNVPTNTCVAIGPDYAEKIDTITKHLKLY